MKIAIYGGSFNPIGKHHINIAEIALLFVDQVWLMPSFKSITGKILEDPIHRANMCNIAIGDNNKIKISMYEIDNNICDESYNTMKNFLEDYNDGNEYYFILGTDNANTIHTWENWEKFIKIMPFIIIPRSGYISNGDEWYHKSPHIYLNNITPNNKSSTDIRNNIKKNNISDDIDEHVMSYIEEYNLYNFRC